MIVFTRIDDRVIHGQTLVCWLSDYPCEGILIIDNELASNPVMAEIYKSAVPSNIRAYVFNEDVARTKLKEAHGSQKRYFVIFKSVLSCLNLIDVIKTLVYSINVGPASKRPETIQILPTISLNKQEIDAYKELGKTGIKVYFQIIPTQKKVVWSELDKSITDF